MKYKKTSSLTPAKKKFAQIYAETDNASEAVRAAYPAMNNSNSIRNKGYRLLTNAHVLADINKQKERMQIVSAKAVERIESIIDNGKEHNALQASVFAYEQVHGKSRQRIEQSSSYVLVTYDLSGGEAPPVPKDILKELE